jgi:hypothetical protein
MAKVMTPEQFRQCPQGTVFAFGAEWHFGNLLILHNFMGHYENGGWGFYAVNPMWVQSDDCGEAFDRLAAMKEAGASFPAENASTKYMSYDGDEMELFFVFEKSDWDAMRAVVEKSFTKDMEPKDG